MLPNWAAAINHQNSILGSRYERQFHKNLPMWPAPNSTGSRPLRAHNGDAHAYRLPCVLASFPLPRFPGGTSPANLRS